MTEHARSPRPPKSAGSSDTGEESKSMHRTLDEWVGSSSEAVSDISSSNVSVKYVSDSPYEIRLTNEVDIISLKIGPTRGLKAWNTDKVSALSANPGRAYLFPAGSYIYSHADVTSSFPLIEVSKTFRRPMSPAFSKMCSGTLWRSIR